mmetsp:Transcript_17677/g.33317  ORF Transcript_17677/g.33317 Transcript_17677/m.33317 type:complete len:141 (+) Transcript_17677:25-447(+)
MRGAAWRGQAEPGRCSEPGRLLPDRPARGLLPVLHAGLPGAGTHDRRLCGSVRADGHPVLLIIFRPSFVFAGMSHHLEVGVEGSEEMRTTKSSSVPPTSDPFPWSPLPPTSPQAVSSGALTLHHLGSPRRRTLSMDGVAN